jgi:hypothetical protein
MSCRVLYVQVLLSDEDTEYLRKHASTIVDTSHYTQHIKPAHMTVCYHRDLDSDTFSDLIQTHYKPLQTQEISLTVTGVAADQSCLAYLVKLTTQDSIKIFPAEKNCHLTMMLTDNVKPVYSNGLIARLKAKGVQGGEAFVLFNKPLIVKGSVDIVHK